MIAQKSEDYEVGHELEYLVCEELALRIRDFLLEYVLVDEHGLGKPDFSYPVHSVYLDSDRGFLHDQLGFEDESAVELRLRYYGVHPDHPVYFEIKRHVTDIIRKQRCPIKREAVETVLFGQLPDPWEMESQHPVSELAIEDFLSLMARLNAQPKWRVDVRREAYHDFYDRCRVTIDRPGRITNEPRHFMPEIQAAHPWHEGHAVVLRIKFPDRFPDWCREMVEIFDLA